MIKNLATMLNMKQDDPEDKHFAAFGNMKFTFSLAFLQGIFKIYFGLSCEVKLSRKMFKLFLCI